MTRILRHLRRHATPFDPPQLGGCINLWATS